MVHAFNPSTQETEADGPQEFQASLKHGEGSSGQKKARTSKSI